MNMTHYMELLATNQPWNLIIFMAAPVILAETLAITELHVLYTRNFDSPVRAVNRYAGIAAGVYFFGIFVYLTVNAVIPLTLAGAWRGWFDVVAVGSYLSGVVPLFGIALLELGVVRRDRTAAQKLVLHAVFVAIFLVVAHVAMIFGMLDPTSDPRRGGGSRAYEPLTGTSAAGRHDRRNPAVVPRCPAGLAPKGFAPAVAWPNRGHAVRNVTIIKC